MSKLLLQAMTSKPIDRLMTKVMGPFVTIYTLHRPTSVDHSFHGIDEHLLEQCLQYALARGYVFASIDELVTAAQSGKQLTKPTLCFTLDDGYADQAAHLIPVLLKYQAKPTLFVITDFVDQRDWPWDAKLAYMIWNLQLSQTHFVFRGQSITLDCATPERRLATRRAMSLFGKTLDKNGLREFLHVLKTACAITPPEQPPANYVPATWSQLRDLEEQGLRVGAHTCSHHVLSALNNEQVLRELQQSKARIVAEMKNPSQVFCYPSGMAKDFSASEHPPLVAEAGFSSAVTTISKPTNLVAIADRPYLIDRIGFPESLERFMRYSSWVEVLRNKIS
jgi:peptidoglycan/xylan/chitin deacetylase (PgdA/CDA1 family)